MKALFLIVVLFLLKSSFVITSSAQDLTHSLSEKERIERLVQLGHLWGQVAFFHPYLAYKDIDWDAAMVEHLPAIEKANSKEELSDALQSLLNVLNDPVTRVVSNEEPQEERVYPDLLDDIQPSSHFTEDSILVVKMTDYVDLSDYANASQQLENTLLKIKEAKRVVFDFRNLRDAGPDAGILIDYMFSQIEAGGLFYSKPYAGPAKRRRIHYGYSLDGFDGGGVYSSGMVSIEGKRYFPAVQRTVPAVFLINGTSHIPDFALGLQHQGSAVILSEGPISEIALTSSRTLKFEEGVEVALRLNELLFPNGETGFSPDKILDTNPQEEIALGEALDYARSFQVGQQKQGETMGATITGSPISETSAFPSREERILAAFKIWNVVEYFFAYKHLMDEPWEPVLSEYLSEFEAAANPLEYELAVARMITHLQDGHVVLRGSAFGEYIGRARVPVRVRFIEGVPIVTGFRDESIATASGINIGDEILEIDGMSVEERIAQIAPYYAASNSWTHKFYIAFRLLRGSIGTICKLKVKGDDDEIRNVELPRDRRFSGGSYRTGEVIRVLDNNIGYVDLDRLTLPESESMFTNLKDTKGIIFDMRGYPNIFVPSIALALSIEPDVPMAFYRMPIIEASTTEASTGEELVVRSYREIFQFIKGVSNEAYDRPTVMLIDERTQSAAETAGLGLVAANGTVLVGSETAGANGNITSLNIPGGVSVQLTGLEILHPDGTQFQRKGLQPDIRVLPTIKGIRDGRDEVLEAAIDYLNENANGE